MRGCGSSERRRVVILEVQGDRSLAVIRTEFTCSETQRQREPRASLGAAGAPSPSPASPPHRRTRPALRAAHRSGRVCFEMTASLGIMGKRCRSPSSSSPGGPAGAPAPDAVRSGETDDPGSDAQTHAGGGAWGPAAWTRSSQRGRQTTAPASLSPGCKCRTQCPPRPAPRIFHEVPGTCVLVPG